MYCAPRFRNILAIHLLSVFYSDPELKYLTSGIQQLFFPAPEACIVYQAYRDLSAYLSDSGRISVITEILEAIEYLTPEQFYVLLSMDKDNPLHISPLNIAAKMPRTSTEKQPAFLQPP